MLSTLPGMPDTTVALADYIEGRLPDVCVVTGRSTTDRFVHVTEVLPEGIVDRMLARVERIATAPPRFGRVLVVRGSIPLDAGVQTRLRRVRRAGTVLLTVAPVGLIAIAWSAAPWAPVGASAAIAAVGVAAWMRAAPRRRLPGVVVDEGAGTVELRRVHGEFARAAGARPGG